MGLVEAPFAPQILFQRPNEDADGNKDWSDVGTFAAVPEVGGPEVANLGSPNQNGLVFVQRGTAVQIGDQFTWSGQRYRLTGGPFGDMNHPITNDDLGWVSYTCTGQAARWGTG